MYGVFARRFNASGAPQGAELQVNTYTSNHQRSAAITLDGAGRFVVTWASYLQDGSGYGVFARRFNSAGQAVGGEIAINVYTVGAQRVPRVSVDGAGRFVVAWDSVNEDGATFGIFARQIDPAGTAAAAQFQVNTYTLGSQNSSRVAMNAQGRFVVAWTSGHDYGTYGAFAQRFAVLDPFDIDGSGSLAPLTDGLLLLRFLFGFTGPTLVNGAVDAAACTRCDASAIEAYLQSLN